MKKKTAVIADATSSAFFFPIWHEYYGEAIGYENLHIVTYEGLKSEFANFPLGNVWALNAKYDDQLRCRVISDLVALLLYTHDVVLRCDIDEILQPDLTLYSGLADFVERNEQPYVTAHGIDIFEHADEAPLDYTAPIIGVQRRFGLRGAALNKTCLTTRPLRWAAGFHSANVMPNFSRLYNLHLKFSDLSGRIAWHEQMLRGLEPGTRSHKYFDVGAEHLAQVQKFHAALPVGGAETEAAFDKRFLDTVQQNTANGIFQGEFMKQNFLIRLDTPQFVAGLAGADPDLAAGKRLQKAGEDAEPWWQIDLGAVQEVAQIVVQATSGSDPRACLSISGSRDGGGGTLLAAKIGGEFAPGEGHQSYSATLPAPVPARFIRVGQIGALPLELERLRIFAVPRD